MYRVYQTEKKKHVCPSRALRPPAPRASLATAPSTTPRPSARLGRPTPHHPGRCPPPCPLPPPPGRPTADGSPHEAPTPEQWRRRRRRPEEPPVSRLPHDAWRFVIDAARRGGLLPRRVHSALLLSLRLWAPARGPSARRPPALVSSWARIPATKTRMAAATTVDFIVCGGGLNPRVPPALPLRTAPLFRLYGRW